MMMNTGCMTQILSQGNASHVQSEQGKQMSDGVTSGEKCGY